MTSESVLQQGRRENGLHTHGSDNEGITVRLRHTGKTNRNSGHVCKRAHERYTPACRQPASKNDLLERKLHSCHWPVVVSILTICVTLATNMSCTNCRVNCNNYKQLHRHSFWIMTVALLIELLKLVGIGLARDVHKIGLEAGGR